MKDNRIKLSLGAVIVGLGLMVGVMGMMGNRALVQAQAVEEATEAGEAEEMVVMEKTEEAGGVDYYLSYPGILPDHPLYWVKMIRDRVQLWLTTKPLAKAEKLLLYADKRLGAGWALIEGNKVELGLTTLTKGEKYLERVMAETTKLGEGGEEMRFKEKLGKAVMKHEEVLSLLGEKLGDEYKGMMEQMLQTTKKGK